MTEQQIYQFMLRNPMTPCWWNEEQQCFEMVTRSKQICRFPNDEKVHMDQQLVQFIVEAMKNNPWDQLYWDNSHMSFVYVGKHYQQLPQHIENDTVYWSKERRRFCYLDSTGYERVILTVWGL